MSDDIWNFERIHRMIEDGVEESIHLDYKGAGSLAKISQKRDEIIKDVTAFANSDGGVIIYGVAEHGDAARKHLPESIDPINRNEISKEWLEHVISNAAPRIPNIRIHPIPISTDDTKCLYVVKIPKGETAHQAADGRYYRRYNFESVFMRDHEVRDVMHRTTAPRLEVEAFLGIRERWEESSFLLRLRNVSSRMARHYAALVRLPPKLDGTLASPTHDDVIIERTGCGTAFEVSLRQAPGRAPLFPKSEVLLKLGIRVDVSRIEMRDGQPLNPRSTIEVEVFADDMEPLRLEFDPSQIRDAWGPPL